MGDFFIESNERSSTMEILSVSVANGIYPASESDRDTNPGASLANYKVVHKGDIVYNSMRMWQGAVGSSIYDGIVSPAYVVVRPVVELDSTCFGYLLRRPCMLYKYLCDSQGNSKDTQTLKYEKFAEIDAKVPQTLKEQRAIAAYFSRLDSLITLHQRKQFCLLPGGLTRLQHAIDVRIGVLDGLSVILEVVVENVLGDSALIPLLEHLASRATLLAGIALKKVDEELLLVGHVTHP